ncbi:dihydrofolate reductase family protein [Guptibacillus algicola]|uniref:dihydrofolate reductase family protein n=1 Tax=Guptibacillus algicola TaxID=225844 RepID=UPI001CD4E123|nr:dihydrofolate reductase family protein [Alkalihalobacillus algicola]MCA0988136.1 dihydrofolate reductase family protein [Alkalihalobacillus algicola]
MTNKRKVSVYIATSVDGYIATTDDSLDWLFRGEIEGDAGYSEFYEGIDTVLIGRRTYDWFMEQEKGNYPYKGIESYVFTKTPVENTDYVTFINEDIATFTRELKQQEGKTIWLVGGSEIVYTLMREKLVDEFIISVAPSLLGKGIPLFKESEIEADLVLKDVKQFGQFAQLHYEMK